MEFIINILKGGLFVIGVIVVAFILVIFAVIVTTILMEAFARWYESIKKAQDKCEKISKNIDKVEKLNKDIKKEEKALYSINGNPMSCTEVMSKVHNLYKEIDKYENKIKKVREPSTVVHIVEKYTLTDKYEESNDIDGEEVKNALIMYYNAKIKTLKEKIEHYDIKRI